VKRLRVALALALLLPACGSASGNAGGVTITVLAAASLNRAFPMIAEAFGRSNSTISIRFSFGGTDSLAAQIEQGAPADVFAGASTRYGDLLRAKGLIQPYAIFCTNSLVLVLPASNPAGIGSLEDLTRPGIKVVIGAETVPVGDYTRTVLGNLDELYGHGYSSGVLANVVSNEENVEAVLTKVRLGEADAGFVYVTDARAAGAAISSIDLPDEAQAMAAYPIASTEGTRHPDEAMRFVDFVLGPEGQRILRRAGFGSPPSS
jgi:molybdate transport system substrate-binding protein